jgi:hypothetical protein
MIQNAFVSTYLQSNSCLPWNVLVVTKRYLMPSFLAIYCGDCFQESRVIDVECMFSRFGYRGELAILVVSMEIEIAMLPQEAKNIDSIFFNVISFISFLLCNIECLAAAEMILSLFGGQASSDTYMYALHTSI